MRLPDPGRSNVVLIGSAAYESPDLPDLPAVSRNIRDLQAILTDPAVSGFLPERCTVIADKADPLTVSRTLRQAADAAEDLLLVYFSGHGCIGRRNELFLALGGTDLDELALTTFPYDRLRQILGESSAAVRAVILDCCFSGNAIPAMAGGARIDLGQLVIEGTYVLTSTPTNATALAPVGARYTAFTGELIRLLGEGVSDGPELLTFAEMYRQLLVSARRRGIPLPRQQTTDNADGLALSRNSGFQRCRESEPDTDPRDTLRAEAAGAGAGAPRGSRWLLVMTTLGAVAALAVVVTFAVRYRPPATNPTLTTSPAVTVSKGAACGAGGGAACVGGGACTSVACAYIHVSTSNFAGEVTCTFDSQHGSGGFVAGTWGPNQSKDSGNWYGFADEWIRVKCNGVQGEMTWH